MARPTPPKWRGPSRQGPAERNTRGDKTKPFPKEEGTLGRQYVAIDRQRRRSLLVRENEAGKELGVVHIENNPVA